MTEPSAMDRFDDWVRSIQVMESRDILATPQDLRAGIRLAVEAAKEIGVLEAMDDIHEGDDVTLGVYGGLDLYRINPQAPEQDDG